MSNVKDDKPPRLEGAFAWWARLQDDSFGDPGALARLRRATTPAAAWGEPETARLYAALGYAIKDRDARIEAVAVLAMVLAGVRARSNGALGAALGPKPGGEDPVLHPLRARRLTAARDAAETLRGFREAVALLKETAPIDDLARCVLGWLDPDARDHTRTRFLFDYHGAGFAAPPAPENESPNAPEPTP